MTIQFSTDELEILDTLVTQALSEIGPEIHHTDKRGYKTELIHRQDRLRGLKDRFDAVLASAVSMESETMRVI